MSWDREFDEPIHGLITLRDAANYIVKLPKGEQAKPHWQTAVDMLMKVAEQGFPLMFADIAMKTALLHGKQEPPKEPRRKAVKKYRIVR